MNTYMYMCIHVRIYMVYMHACHGTCELCFYEDK